MPSSSVRLRRVAATPLDARYLLTTFANSYQPKDPRDLMDANHTAERIIPRNAPARIEWTDILGEERQHVYDEFINNLGNLTFTVYNAGLLGASFEGKCTLSEASIKSVWSYPQICTTRCSY